MSSLRVLLISTVAVLLVHEGETHKCWVCESEETDAGAICGYPFLGSADVKQHQIHIKECNRNDYLPLLKINPNQQFFCLKHTEEIRGVKVITRACAIGMPNSTIGNCMYPKEEYHTGLAGGKLLTCDVCAGDLCNAAGRVEAVAVLLTPLLLLLVSH